ncbi:hypothetical protein [Gorillibacterium sp. sgz5001074]|uniref:hypothetical protein n=1 Tax=Gorillibacterium sp. sgz5001074 TaxID=3446695 RepID=UPI003F6770F1
MRERNRFTWLLAAAGLTSLLIALATLFTSESPWIILLVCLGLSFITLFPVKLPNGFFYTFDHIPAGYLIMASDWKLAIIPPIVGLIAISIRYRAKFRPFRLFVTLGMYSIAFFAASYIEPMPQPSHSFIHVIAMVITIELMNLALNKGIQASVLGTNMLNTLTWIPNMYHISFNLFSCLLIFRLIHTESYLDLIQEIVFSCLTLFILTLLSRIALQQQTLSGELREDMQRLFSSTERIFWTLDLQGRIQSSNTYSEILLGINIRPGTYIWDLSVESEELKRFFPPSSAWTTAEVELHLCPPDQHNTIRLTAILSPYFRNNRMAGIYLVGSIKEFDEPTVRQGRSSR